MIVKLFFIFSKKNLEKLKKLIEILKIYKILICYLFKRNGIKKLFCVFLLLLLGDTKSQCFR